MGKLHRMMNQMILILRKMFIEWNRMAEPKENSFKMSNPTCSASIILRSKGIS